MGPVAGSATKEAGRRSSASLPPVVVGVVAFLVGAARLGTTPLSKVWAEDGGVFLQDFSAHGWRSIGYVYAGYLSVPSRMIATVGGAAVPLTGYSQWCVVASLAVVGTLAGYIFASARSRIGWWALGPALAMVLVPAVRGESLGDLANLQNFLIPAACWALPEQSYSGPVVTLLAALASPLAIVALPLLFVRRAFRSVWALVAGLAIQGVAIVAAPRSARPGVSRSMPSMRALIDDIRSMLQYALGNPGFRHGETLITLVGVVTLGAVFVKAKERPLVAYLFVACALVLVIATTPESGAASRYVVAPSVLLVSGLTLLKLPRRVAIIAVVLGLVLTVMSFPVSAYRRSGPTWNGHTCHRGVTIANVALAPAGWGDAVLNCSAFR
jgi:hypothetical protein